MDVKAKLNYKPDYRREGFINSMRDLILSVQEYSGLGLAQSCDKCNQMEKRITEVES